MKIQVKEMCKAYIKYKIECAYINYRCKNWQYGCYLPAPAEVAQRDASKNDEQDEKRSPHCEPHYEGHGEPFFLTACCKYG